MFIQANLQVKNSKKASDTISCLSQKSCFNSDDFLDPLEVLLKWEIVWHCASMMHLIVLVLKF